MAEQTKLANTLLPTISRMVQEVKRQLDDPDSDLDQIGKTLEKDPMLSAQVLRLTNSALYKGMEEIKTLSQAVTRLGLRRMKEVLYEASTQQVFQSRQPEIKEALGGLWKHSLVVAHLARDIHGKAGGQDSEAVFLAGLLHDIGKAIAAAHLVEVERGVGEKKASSWIDVYEFLAVISDINRRIGAAVAESWSFPPLVSEAINDGGEYVADDKTAPTNAVRFANALAKKHGNYAGRFDEEQVDGEIVNGRSILGIDEEVEEALVNKLAELK